MHKNLIGLIFLALIISCPALASSEADEPEEQLSEASEEQEAAQPSGPLDTGHGWQLMRTMELGNNTGKFVHMVLVDRDKSSDITVYNSAIHRICGKEKEFCRIRFWNLEKYIPEKISLNAEQSRNLLVEHTFNRTAGINETRWSCSVNPGRQDCFTQ